MQFRLIVNQVAICVMPNICSHFHAFSAMLFLHPPRNCLVHGVNVGKIIAIDVFSLSNDIVVDFSFKYEHHQLIIDQRMRCLS